MNPSSRVVAVMWTCLATSLSAGAAAQAQSLSGEALVEALRAGGHVIVMRHAQSPRGAPDAASASPGNSTLERQLDETGRQTAAAMGEALRALRIPIGDVLSSPTFRALETARLAEFGNPQPVSELDAGNGDRAAWLRTRAAEAPRSETNTILVTHAPNVSGAFGEDGDGMVDGEALVIRPGAGGAAVVARIRIDQWPALVAQ
jgi:phosphohistidine phosphatase SixA